MKLEEAKKELIDLYDIADVILTQYSTAKITYVISEEQRIALKTVLKELEKVTEARNWYFEHIVGKIATPEMLTKILRQDYVSKDEIREKIEELTNRLKYYDTSNPLEIINIKMIESKIEVLQELLK